MESKQIVDDFIKSKPVVVFSKSYCPFCVTAKKLLSEIVPADKMNVMELEDRKDCTEIQGYLKELTGASSVPRIFINQKSIGGCDDLKKANASGELKKLLVF